MSLTSHAAHNANVSTDVLPDVEILAVEAVSLSLATVSIFAAFVAFYWYATMATHPVSPGSFPPNRPVSVPQRESTC
jgi:hypothetical protein